jgi:hypothetical protein
VEVLRIIPSSQKKKQKGVEQQNQDTVVKIKKNHSGPVGGKKN